MYSKTAIVVGASSGVGRALAQALAAEGYAVILAARSEKDIAHTCYDIKLRHGVDALPFTLDLTGTEEHLQSFVSYCHRQFPVINQVFMVAGNVDDADNGMASHTLQQQIINTNFTGIIQLSSNFLSTFAQQGEGQLWLFSSIATARPRGANVVYGAAKAALEFYGSGMQHSFAAHPRIRVKVIALGYVDTALSFGRKLLFKPVSSQAVAQVVINKLDKDFRFIYYPAFWNLITFTLRQLPWMIYKKLNF